MYKACKTQESAQRQRQLEQGLLDMMSQRHFEDISISDLCRTMQIPRKTFYRYFDSKDGALHGLLDHTLMDYESFAIPGEGQKRTLRRDLECFFLFWKEKRALLDALAASGLSGVLMERAINFALSDGVLPTRFLPEDTPEMQRHITMFAVCGLLSMVLTWHREEFVHDFRDLAQAAERVISKPLFPSAETFMK